MPGAYDIEGVSLTGDRYTVEQSIIRNKYAATDEAGNVVLRGKQKLLRAKEEFPFVDGDGEDVFTVRAGGIIDVAGNYMLTDRAGRDVVLLDNDFSIFQDTWRVRDPDTNEELARLDSRGALYTLARHYLPFGALIPFRYEITDADGNHVGVIDGQFTLLRDRYDVVIEDASTVPKEAVVAAAMVIDAIQGH